MVKNVVYSKITFKKLMKISLYYRLKTNQSQSIF